MKQNLSFDGLAKVWKRVEAARPTIEGSAGLMPRKKQRGLPLKPFPLYREEKTTF